MQKAYEAYAAAWNLKLSSKCKLVLLNILWRYNYLTSRDAFPSQSRIARDTGLSRATVQRALDELVSLGFLSRKVNKNNGFANEYRPEFGHILEGASPRGTPLPHSEASTMKLNFEDKSIKENEEEQTPSLRSGVEPLKNQGNSYSLDSEVSKMFGRKVRVKPNVS